MGSGNEIMFFSDRIAFPTDLSYSLQMERVTTYGKASGKTRKRHVGVGIGWQSGLHSSLCVVVSRKPSEPPWHSEKSLS